LHYFFSLFCHFSWSKQGISREAKKQQRDLGIFANKTISWHFWGAKKWVGRVTGTTTFF
jgi:hypothetical protein